MLRKTNLFFITIAILVFTKLAGATDVEVNKVPADFYKISAFDVVYGKEDAPIQVLEYYSLVCPHCAYFYTDIFPKLKKSHIDTGKVRWIKRSFVTDHRALKATLLLACASSETRDKYLKILLDKQSSWSYPKDPSNIFANIASLGGISKQSFQKCMNDSEQIQTIENLSNQAAELAKISTTPAFYINQERFTGFTVHSFDDRFAQLLNKP